MSEALVAELREHLAELKTQMHSLVRRRSEVEDLIILYQDVLKIEAPNEHP